MQNFVEDVAKSVHKAQRRTSDEGPSNLDASNLNARFAAVESPPRRSRSLSPSQKNSGGRSRRRSHSDDNGPRLSDTNNTRSESFLRTLYEDRRQKDAYMEAEGHVKNARDRVEEENFRVSHSVSRRRSRGRSPKLLLESVSGEGDGIGHGVITTRACKSAAFFLENETCDFDYDYAEDLDSMGLPALGLKRSFDVSAKIDERDVTVRVACLHDAQACDMLSGVIHGFVATHSNKRHVSGSSSEHLAALPVPLDSFEQVISSPFYKERLIVGFEKLIFDELQCVALAKSTAIFWFEKCVFVDEGACFANGGACTKVDMRLSFKETTPRLDYLAQSMSLGYLKCLNFIDVTLESETELVLLKKICVLAKEQNWRIVRQTNYTMIAEEVEDKTLFLVDVKLKGKSAPISKLVASVGANGSTTDAAIMKAADEATETKHMPDTASNAAIDGAFLLTKATETKHKPDTASNAAVDGAFLPTKATETKHKPDTASNAAVDGAFLLTKATEMKHKPDAASKAAADEAASPTKAADERCRPARAIDETRRLTRANDPAPDELERPSASTGGTVPGVMASGTMRGVMTRSSSVQGRGSNDCNGMPLIKGEFIDEDSVNRVRVYRVALKTNWLLYVCIRDKWQFTATRPINKSWCLDCSKNCANGKDACYRHKN